MSIPLVFTNPGNYVGKDGKPKCAFPSGAVYFRHGAKSQPCTSDDLRNFLQREIEIIRESWLSGIRKVIEAPEGSQVIIVPANEANVIASETQAIRLVDDPNAPAHKLLNPNKTHPYRQGQVVRLFNERLGGKKRINSHDVHSVRHIHKVDDMPTFFYQPLFNSPQYSAEFIDWLILKYQQDETFFDKAKQEMHKIVIERNKNRVKRRRR